MFALERLVDHASALPSGARMAIDLYEPHPAPGAGPVYDPRQPPYLRMNFAADQLDMWWPGSGAVPEGERLPFVAWRAEMGGGDDAYPPRGEAGRYLSDGFRRLLRWAPANVDVCLVPHRAEAVRPCAGRWEVEAAGATSRYDEVLIATGHETASSAALVHGWSLPAPLVPAVFPVERTLGRDAVPAGATVAVRGFALTFIDAALALTEGRGGTFEALDHPYRLRYLAGADDVATIMPFTRSGRPMLAKPDPALAAGAPALAEIAAAGRARILALAGPVRLHDELVPILAGCAEESLLALGGDRAEDPLAPAEEIERSLAVGAGLARPGPSWAHGHVWRSLYPAIVARLGGDGLQRADWPAFLRLAAEYERLAFGPPPVNAAKLLALIGAGRVDLAHLRGGALIARGGRARLQSVCGEHQVDVVVDAVLASPGAAGLGSLSADLIADGHARIAPGQRGLDVAGDATCRALDGSPSHGLAALGRPTEDSVIGNDTLSRSLHPQADRWARRVAERCGAHAPARAREGATA